MEMEPVIVVVFIVGYLLIAFENPLRINKTASAILTGVVCWTLFIVAVPSKGLLASEHFAAFVESVRLESADQFAAFPETRLYKEFVLSELTSHLGSISAVLFFLMGAMTIVELIDAHHGFRVITDRISTRSTRWLLWIICSVTFFLSAILDNLTTTIVMVSLIRKLIPDREMKFLFIGMIVIAANAGGAWTPMGDVTTTMLWIGGQVSAANIMKVLFLPSLVCMILPLLYLSFRLKGEIGPVTKQVMRDHDGEVGGGTMMLVLGIGVMLGVPVFKMVTHLPPYIGMLAGLGILWVVSELIHPELDEAVRKNYSAAAALSRIDVPSILFFLGILLAVGALESLLTLQHFSELLSSRIGDMRIIVVLIGVMSAIVDNVPLVAAAMGMYSLETFPQDHFIWEFLAYCAGTGGSLLIIGSAAGVAAMGMEKIDFIWYFRKISFLAFIGYVGGALTYLAIYPIVQ